MSTYAQRRCETSSNSMLPISMLSTSPLSITMHILTAVNHNSNYLPKGPSNPSAQSSKKDGAASNQTPLEKMLMNAGPIRNDGSDKFFGMENVWPQSNSSWSKLIYGACSSEIPGQTHRVRETRTKLTLSVIVTRYYSACTIPYHFENMSSTTPSDLLQNPLLQLRPTPHLDPIPSNLPTALPLN
jgi:hypothetical protein